MRNLRLFALLAFTASVALAQKETGTTPAGDPTNLGPAFSPARMGSLLNFATSGHHHGSRSSPLSFLTDPFLSGLTPSGYPPPTSSPIVVLQSAAESLSSPANQDPQQGQPLLIELRGDRYVQINANGVESADRSGQPDYFQGMPAAAGAQRGRQSQQDLGKTNLFSSRPRISRGPVSAKNASGTGVLPHQLTPTVLIYRDGRHEEVREYSIADGVLCARGDYYADGYWNKKIELAVLDLPQTVKANQERGVKFVLPDSPNNVVLNW